jgi:hypothetical protein
MRAKVKTRMNGTLRRLFETILLLAAVVFPISSSAAEEEDARVDRATDRGLEYLARMQNPDGSWPANQYNKNASVASLTIMAFMAKGHTPGEGRYGQIINKGIDYVLSVCDPKTGYIAAKDMYKGMYCHGASTLMLAEAVGMTSGEREKRIRAALEKAVILILQAQKVPRERSEQQGGWRYTPVSRDSDISVTGWQLMSLRAAKNAGADVPLSAITDGVAYIKRSASMGGGFGYQVGGGPNQARTGTGILALEICGQHNTPEAVQGAEWLMKNPPAWPETYFYYAVYYCSQAMFQVGGKYWEFYQPRLESVLLGLQQSDGSWPLSSDHEGEAGPVYSTSMAVLALSVKYHYLPIYQR